ncbi:MAG: S8 family peptidase [Bacteroidetes bacterium]|nr:S8 family peptidase [Bacteroidota bacterium]
MNASRFYTLIFCLLIFAVEAQKQPGVNTKLDLRTWIRLQNGVEQGKIISLIVQGDLRKIEQLTVKLGGVYKFGRNRIASIDIPENNLLLFSESVAVEKIENPHSEGRALMDTSRIRNNVDSVHEGAFPLAAALKGKGVIIGIIDGGIYFQHPDFKNPDGSTRIRYIWDQRISGGTTPAPYNYGREWNQADINSGNCTHVEPFSGSCADFGHGTCVAGIAAGNGRADSANPNLKNTYVGIAPESEIIAVRVGSGSCYASNFLASVADAVDYIFKKADALGMPCVINTSVGTYYGSHDGKDLSTKLIEDLLDERSGRVLVASAGNAGQISHHLGYNLTNDSAFTFFKYNTTLGSVYFDLWADSTDFTNAYFAIGANDTSGNDLGRTSYLNVIADFNPAPGLSVVQTRNLFVNSQLVAITIEVANDNGRYHVEVYMNPANKKLLWRLQTTGSGRFDLWSSESLIGNSDMVRTISGNTIQYPEYRHPDSLKTMVTSWQCSDKVITVGNYSNRASYLDYDSLNVDLTASPYFEVVGKRYATSSLGPTRDNRLKPDIMASGSTTLCTGDQNTINALVSSSQKYKVAIGRKHIRNGGTSMASPVVAGIAALYLEKRPTATWDEVKKALIWTAIRDSFTTISPNPEYGYGKVNAFQALTNAGVIYGAMDTSCINFNPSANVDTSGCVAKVYGVTDTTCLNYDSTANVSSNVCIAKVYGCTDDNANNYNASANVDNGSCDYSTTVRVITNNRVSIRAVPNPFSSQTTFQISNMNLKQGEVIVYNILGQEADRFSVNKGKAQYVFQSAALHKGIYTYTLICDGKHLATGKLIVE